MAWFRRLLVISGALSLCLLLLNLQTKGRCYIQPCEQGSGLADLFTVHFGLSFQGISAAAALLGHALYGWAVAARLPTEALRTCANDRRRSPPAARGTWCTWT